MLKEEAPTFLDFATERGLSEKTSDWSNDLTAQRKEEAHFLLCVNKHTINTKYWCFWAKHSITLIRRGKTICVWKKTTDRSNGEIVWSILDEVLYHPTVGKSECNSSRVEKDQCLLKRHTKCVKSILFHELHLLFTPYSDISNWSPSSSRFCIKLKWLQNLYRTGFAVSPKFIQLVLQI